MNTTLKQLIKSFLKGKLTHSEEKELFDWAKENKEEFLFEQGELENLLKLKRDPETQKKWKQLKTLIFKEEVIYTPTHIRIIKSDAFKIAASLLIGIFIASIVLMNSPLNTEQLQIVQELNITTPLGAKTNLTLPDGSLVWLNSGSKLTYPTKFDKKRNISLKGEAYFEVKKDQTPFIVKTASGSVMVKGTSFNVNAYEDEIFRTTLVEGIVTVKALGAKKELTLKPGEQLSVLSDKIKINPVDTKIYTSWINGKLIFENEILPDAVRRLERWYNVKIKLDNDERLAKINYTGTLEMESFSEVLQLLEITAPIHYSYNEKTRTISIKHK